MSSEVRLDNFPESVSEGTISQWYRSVGDHVKRGETLLDIETDKVILEIPAPTDGVLSQLLVKQGDIIEGNTLLALIDDSQPASLPVAPSDTTEPSSPTDETARMSPAVRALITQHQLESSQIPATGKGGRLLKEDVVNFLNTNTAAPPPPSLVAPTTSVPPPILEHPAAPPLHQRETRRVPMTRIRARIAERLLEAQQSAAILTTFNEVDLSEVMHLREQHGEAFEKRHGVRLGFMSFFVKAATEALKSFPIINASIEDSDILHHDFFDVGIAVGSDRGLVVPVLRDADQLSFAAIEQQISHYAAKAKAGSLALEDISGGTFTITNGGVFGSLLSTPILNPPQSAILGLHKIQKRPVVVADEIVIRPMMYLALSYDHRIIDGSDAVRFLVSIKQKLEQPATLLLQL